MGKTQSLAEGSSSERLHALDAVRGGALMLGIAFHATMSFLPGHQVWPVVDADRSLVLGGTFYVLHIFRMTTFFLIAGFFAHLTFHRRGQAAFIRDRLKRIALPLVVGWPILFAAIVGVSIWAFAQSNGGVLPKVAPPMPAPPPLAFPLTHLWFLYVLLLLDAATIAARAAVSRLDGAGRFRAGLDAIVRGLMLSPFGPLVLAAPVALALGLQRPWLMWFGVPTPDNSLIPNTPALVGFGAAFAFGWLLHRQPDLIRGLERRWSLNLAVAVALTAGLLAWLGLTPVVTPAPQAWTTWAYAAAYGLAIWTWSFALIGLALRFLSGESPARRYVADASYWLYLIHLPIIMALQVVVAPLPWPWWVKYPLILAVAFPLMFASYQLMVRRSFVGAILNGRRQPPRLPRLSPKSTQGQASQEPAR
ncbi:MAG: acyltransferase family protein [Phenylobacterium sp.]